MTWICAICKKKINIDVTTIGTMCPYCKCKAFLKERPTMIKRMKSN